MRGLVGLSRVTAPGISLDRIASSSGQCGLVQISFREIHNNERTFKATWIQDNEVKALIENG